MGRVGLSLLLLTGCMARIPLSATPTAPAPVALNPADQIWQGMIHCDAMPPMAHIPLRQAITVSVHDGVAVLSRDIFKPDTSIPSGNQETASGPVAADGAVTLNGRGATGPATFSSSYSGILFPSGRPAELTGHQLWTTGHGGADRACTLSLHRVG